MRVFLEHATKERKREEYPLKNSRRDRRHRLNLLASLRYISVHRFTRDFTLS